MMGYDSCVKGAVCLSGECKQICDPQGGGTSCATNFSCGRYESLLQSGGTAVGGVCDHDCNPLNQTRVAGAVPACGSPTPANPTKGCYNSDGYVQFTCGPANSDVLSRTDDALPKLNGSGTAYPNGCAPGYQALVYESATTMTVKCTGLCAPRDVDSAKAGADATYGAGDPTKTAKLVTGSSPAVGNAVCKTGKKGSTQGGQGNGSTQNCLHMWPFLATGGAPSSSQYNDTLGVCFNFGEWTWDHDRNAGTPEVTRPSCTAVAPAGSQADDAAYLGCYSLATTQGLPGARSSIVTAQQEMRVGYGPAQLVRHRYR